MKPRFPAPGDVHPSDDEIFDVAHEILEPAVAQGLLAHVRACAACEARFRTAAQDRDFWLARPPGTAVRRPAVQAAAAPAAPRRLASLHSFPRWATPVAAAAALAMVALAPSLRPGAGHRGDPRWLPVVHEHTLLRTPALAGAGVGLDRALGVYRAGDAAGALRELESLTIPPEAAFESSLRQVYLASAQVLNARPEDALRTLDALDVPTLPEPWRRWARWTRYLAARDAHRDAEARTLLGDLARSANDVGDLARAEQVRLQAQ